MLLERVNQCLSYSPDTGVFTWSASASNRIAGKVAGSLDNYGYRRITIDNRQFKAHRLAWFVTHGEMPVGELDHINGSRDDNRIANLRLATRAVNTQNVRCRADNTTGLMGVSLYKPTGKWKAQIKAKSKTHFLGYFASPEEAHSAYMAAKRELHPGYARTTGERLLRGEA